jgi:hypothetical protein
MPFDATDFDPDPKPPPPPKRNVVKERILCGLAMAVALILLVLPISAGALVDMARYVGGL